MTTEVDNSIEILSDLIELNNDRVNGFTKAVEKLDSKDQDLKSVFDELIQQSQRFIRELTSEAMKIDSGYKQDSTSTIGGSMHRAWIDIKTLFKQRDREAILTECERGEDAIKRAYKDALSSNNDLDKTQIDLIAEQATVILSAHDKIRSLRNRENQE
jgi:uncharacterized protein (TIGR02284 family)